MTAKKQYGNRRISGQPWEKQSWEQPKQYQIFSDWLHSDRRLNFQDLALKHEVQVDTVKRYSRDNMWEARYQRTKGFQSLPEHLTLPAEELVPERAIEPNQDALDPALSRLMSQEELLTEDFYTASNLYKSLLKTVEMAVANLKPEDLKTASELRSITSVLMDLQKARGDMSERITGVQKLAAAITAHRRSKRK